MPTPTQDSENKAPIKDRLKEETRRNIVRAGTKAFAELGFHGMKIAAVAREAGVANGTFYLYFKGKEALYHEIIRLAGAKLAAQIFAAHNYHAAAGNADRAEIEAVLEFAEQNRYLMRIALDTVVPEAFRQTDLFKPLVDIRVRELERGVREGHINPAIHPEVGARAEIGMMLSVVHWWQGNRSSASKTQLVDTLVQLRRSWVINGTGIDDISQLLSQWDARF